MTSNKPKAERHILWFWGGLDGLYILHYVIGSVRRGHTPYITDVQDMANLLQQQGGLPIALMLLNLVLQLSIILSCFLLLKGGDFGKYVGLTQIPLRLLFMTPSLSLLVIWAGWVPSYTPWLMLALIVGSEAIKGTSLWWLLRHRRISSVRS